MDKPFICRIPAEYFLYYSEKTEKIQAISRIFTNYNPIFILGTTVWTSCGKIKLSTDAKKGKLQTEKERIMKRRNVHTFIHSVEKNGFILPQTVDKMKVS